MPTKPVSGLPNGNISDYLSSNGVVTAHREFDPYGNTTAATGPMANNFNFWFSSKYCDQETGLYYYGYRYYSPEMGRWVNRDPVEEFDSLNSVVWSRNAGIDNVDVLGMWIIKRAGGSRALAEAEEWDTVRSLAQRIGLRSSEYKKWLTEDVHWGYMPMTEDEVLCGTFEVPNTVVMFWAEPPRKKLRHSWNENVTYMKQQGFSVHEEDAHIGSLRLYQLQIVLGRLSKPRYKYLHGLVYDGHSAALWGLIDYTDAERYPTDGSKWTPLLDRRKPPVSEYLMALGIMFTCWADHNDSLFTSAAEGAVLYLPPGILTDRNLRIFPVGQYVAPGVQGTKPRP